MSAPEIKPKSQSVEERLQRLEGRVTELESENVSLKEELLKLRADVTVDALEPEERKTARRPPLPPPMPAVSRDSGPYWSRRVDPAEELRRTLEWARNERQCKDLKDRLKHDLGISIGIGDGEKGRNW